MSPDGGQREALRAGDIRRARDLLQFDVDCVRRLNRLCADTGARIVLISSWRWSYGVDPTIDKLIEQGVESAHFHDLPAPPFVNFSDSKFGHVCDWALELYGDMSSRALLAEAGWYCVIDDEPDPRFRYVVQPDSKIGLSDADVDRAARLLSTSSSAATYALMAADYESSTSLSGRGTVTTWRQAEADVYRVLLELIAGELPPLDGRSNADIRRLGYLAELATIAFGARDQQLSAFAARARELAGSDLSQPVPLVAGSSSRVRVLAGEDSIAVAWGMHPALDFGRFRSERRALEGLRG